MDVERPKLIHYAILVFTSLISFRTFQAPSILFLLWLIPIPFYWLFRPEPYKSSYLLLYGSIALATLGILTDMNILKDLAQALSLASFIPFSSFSLLWLLGSFFYFPSTPWLLNKANLRYEGIELIGIALTEMPLLFRLWNKK